MHRCKRTVYTQSIVSYKCQSLQLSYNELTVYFLHIKTKTSSGVSWGVHSVRLHPGGSKRGAKKEGRKRKKQGKGEKKGKKRGAKEGEKGRERKYAKEKEKREGIKRK